MKWTLGDVAAVLVLSMFSLGCPEGTPVPKDGIVREVAPFENLQSASADPAAMKPYVLSFKGQNLDLDSVPWGIDSGGIWTYDQSAQSVTYQRNEGTRSHGDMHYWP